MIKGRRLPDRLLVGLSGGADSVALLLMLLETGSELTAVHVNHGLRDERSDGDEAFVRALCEEKQVPLLVYRAEPPENPGEGWARQARYGFFRQAMQTCDADALALAHHRDDQAETLLLHLLRGSGLNGLTGMAEETELEGMRIIRPLLTVSRTQLREMLKARGQTWREDDSNANPRYLRNALRADVLPRLEQLAPGAAQRIASAASLLAEDETVLVSLTENFLKACPGCALPIDALQAQPKGMQRRILRTWWAEAACPRKERGLSAEQTEALCGLLEARISQRCNLPGGWSAQRGWTHLHLISPEGAQPIPETPAPESGLLRLERWGGDPGDGKTCQVMPRAWLTDCTVRSRRPGDFIRPFGSEGRQSLQDYFVNRRVDAAFRDSVPLLCRGSEVLLCGGVGAGGIISQQEADDPVLVRWEQDFPWQRG